MQAYSVYAMQLAGPGLQLFRHVMGQGVSHLSVDDTIKPGMYHIASGLTGTALQVSEHDHTKIVSWQLEKGVEKLEQQWHLARSGSGYTFQNQKYKNLYLSVASTDTHALVTASECPSTWVFLKIGDRYGIKLAEHDKLLDLHFGRKANGTEIHIWPSDGSTKQTWELVPIITESHEEKNAQPDQGPVELPEARSRKEQEIVDKANRVEKLENEVAQLKDEVSTKDEQIAQHEFTIRKLRADLEARDSARLQARLSQQETEIATLQSKIDRLEYLMSQMRGNITRSHSENR